MLRTAPRLARWQGWAKRYLPAGIASALLAFLVMKFYAHYDLLRSQDIHFLPVWVILSLAPLILSYVLMPYVWLAILGSMGIALSFRKAFQIQYLSHLGKYLPGKIWPYLAQVFLAAQVDIPVKTTVFSCLLLTSMTSLTSLMVFAVSFLLWEDFSPLTRGVVVFAVFSLSVLLFRYHLPEKWLGWLLARWRGMSITWAPLPYSIMTLLLLGSWVLFGLGFHLMLNAFYPVSLQQTVLVVGTFAISWLAGYCAFFVPGGLGVQEGIQVALLALFFPVPVAILIAFASRLWMTAGDLCVSLLAIGLAYHEHRAQRAMYGSPS